MLKGSAFRNVSAPLRSLSRASKRLVCPLCIPGVRFNSSNASGVVGNTVLATPPPSTTGLTSKSAVKTPVTVNAINDAQQQKYKQKYVHRNRKISPDEFFDALDVALTGHAQDIEVLPIQLNRNIRPGITPFRTYVPQPGELNDIKVLEKYIHDLVGPIYINCDEQLKEVLKLLDSEQILPMLSKASILDLIEFWIKKNEFDNVNTLRTLALKRGVHDNEVWERLIPSLAEDVRLFFTMIYLKQISVDGLVPSSRILYQIYHTLPDTGKEREQYMSLLEEKDVPLDKVFPDLQRITECGEDVEKLESLFDKDKSMRTFGVLDRIVKLHLKNHRLHDAMVFVTWARWKFGLPLHRRIGERFIVYLLENNKQNMLLGIVTELDLFSGYEMGEWALFKLMLQCIAWDQNRLTPSWYSGVLPFAVYGRQFQTHRLRYDLGPKIVKKNKKLAKKYHFDLSYMTKKQKVQIEVLKKYAIRRPLTRWNEGVCKILFSVASSFGSKMDQRLIEMVQKPVEEFVKSIHSFTDAEKYEAGRCWVSSNLAQKGSSCIDPVALTEYLRRTYNVDIRRDLYISLVYHYLHKRAFTKDNWRLICWIVKTQIYRDIQLCTKLQSNLFKKARSSRLSWKMMKEIKADDEIITKAFGSIKWGERVGSKGSPSFDEFVRFFD